MLRLDLRVTSADQLTYCTGVAWDGVRRRNNGHIVARSLFSAAYSVSSNFRHPLLVHEKMNPKLIQRWHNDSPTTLSPHVHVQYVLSFRHVPVVL